MASLLSIVPKIERILFILLYFFLTDHLCHQQKISFSNKYFSSYSVDHPGFEPESSISSKNLSSCLLNDNNDKRIWCLRRLPQNPQKFKINCRNILSLLKNDFCFNTSQTFTHRLINDKKYSVSGAILIRHNLIVKKNIWI